MADQVTVNEEFVKFLLNPTFAMISKAMGSDSKTIPEIAKQVGLESNANFIAQLPIYLAQAGDMNLVSKLGDVFLGDKIQLYYDGFQEAVEQLELHAEQLELHATQLDDLRARDEAKLYAGHYKQILEHML